MGLPLLLFELEKEKCKKVNTEEEEEDEEDLQTGVTPKFDSKRGLKFTSGDEADEELTTNFRISGSPPILMQTQPISENVATDRDMVEDTSLINTRGKK